MGPVPAKMQTTHQKLSLTFGFLLLLMLLVGNAWVTRRQLQVQLDDQAWVEHTKQVLFEVAETESLLKDAETGQRGFLYTGEARYLGPYQSSISQVSPHLASLAQLTADNPHQLARVLELRRLTDEKLAELAETISLYQSGHPDAAKTLVLSGVGRSYMDQIREVVRQMNIEENDLSKSRSATYQHSARVTVGSIYLTNSMAAVGLVLLAYFLWRGIELRERHAQLMMEREEWFRSTLTSLGDGVIATDEKGAITFLNPIAERLMGVSLHQTQGKAIQEAFRIFNESTHLPVENPVEKVIEKGIIIGLANHTVLERSDGTLVPIEDSAAPIRDTSGKIVGVVLVFRDATIERRSQELLRRTEKLTAAARLSATVAHEINNPLEAIGNLVYLTKNMDGLPAAAEENLALAELEVQRISHIARQTLGFYRESSNPDQIDLGALIDSVLNIYSNKLQGKHIRIERSYDKCPVIRGMAGELRQVIANLISNAADAVNDGGRIRVSVASLETSHGRIAQVRVEDDGPGIEPALHERIFEPFFTTKKDIGTGLGLWVSKEIVGRHGGSIEVASQSSQTAFTILLPTTESGPEVVPSNL